MLRAILQQKVPEGSLLPFLHINPKVKREKGAQHGNVCNDAVCQKKKNQKATVDAALIIFDIAP